MREDTAIARVTTYLRAVEADAAVIFNCATPRIYDVACRPLFRDPMIVVRWFDGRTLPKQTPAESAAIEAEAARISAKQSR